MRRVILAVIAAGLAGCGGGDGALVAFGHSFVEGGQAGAGTPWVLRAAGELGLAADNRGVGGAESPAVAGVVAEYAPDPDDTVVIEAALNDARRLGRRGLRRYEASLERMLDHLTSSGVPPEIILVADPPIVAWDGYPPHDEGSARVLDAYNRVAAEVAQRHGADVADVGAEWDPAQHILRTDGVHPNDRGQQLIADAVVDEAR